MNETQETMDDVTAVRQMVLSAYPDCVPELVQGATVTELLASVEPARAAYARVAATVAEHTESPVVTPPAVPAGGGTTVIDPGALPPAEKVRRGIAGRQR